MRPGHAAGAFAYPPAQAAMLPIDEPPLTGELIRSRHDVELARLRAAAEAAGRDPDALRIVAVTKGFDADAVLAALESGDCR